MRTEKTLISVCICTYKRPHLLSTLLFKLQNQATLELFYYDIVVVDNDHNQTARSVVEEAQANLNLRISYHCEPEKNIALARNMGVRSARGELLAFLDDDEFPVKDWLLRLYTALHEYRAQGVLGPVKPYFLEKPPEWVIRGKLCERSSFSTGTVITNPVYTRTGNVLLSRTLFSNSSDYFQTEFGLTGGEDVDFFKRMLQKGYKFVWDDEAIVYESVPPDRTKRRYFLTRAFLRGTINSTHFSISDVLKSIVASILYTIALPLFFLVGHHLFMKYLIKNCDHIGKLLGFCGFKIVKERNF